jgi:hypothetical protein
MARKSRTAVLKRQREAKKAEKAQHKRDKRAAREPGEPGDAQVASRDDLAGYGFADDEEDGLEDEAEEA